MSDETNTQSVTTNDGPKLTENGTIAQKPAKPTVDKGAFILEKVSFSGDKEGFSFWRKQFKNGTPEEAEASLNDMIKQWGYEPIVSAINSALTSTMRTKAANSLDVFENDLNKEKTKRAWAERIRNNKDILISEEEAETYKPGEREKTIQGLMKEVAELNKEGKIQEALQILLKVQAMIAENAQSETQAS